ncbi:MAG: hypothetical protein P8H03_08885 [Emcibacteraceae bacterium]|nr:hypothetical protein [Emcibacteraceae bacterium]
MDIVLNIIGLGFIPLLILMLAGGLSDIVIGLREHFSHHATNISILPFNLKADDVIEKFGFRKLEINFSKTN